MSFFATILLIEINLTYTLRVIYRDLIMNLNVTHADEKAEGAGGGGGAETGDAGLPVACPAITLAANVA